MTNNVLRYNSTLNTEDKMGRIASGCYIYLEKNILTNIKKRKVYHSSLKLISALIYNR